MQKVLAVGAMAFLGACGGGGGGSNTPMITTVPFTSFSAIQANQAVTFTGGMSAVVNGTNNGTTVTTLGPVNIDTTSTSGTMTYGPNRNFTALSAVTPFASISFSSTSAGNTFNCTTGVCGLTSTNASAIVIEPTTSPLGWNYQTFGVWERSTSTTSFDSGAFSFGSLTPGSAIPTTGLATFNGLANGFFVDNTNTAFFTTANMTANVDWATRSIGFSTSNTHQVGLTAPSSAGVLNSALNFNGTLTYAAGINAFSGPVNTGGNVMTGNVSGKFYGPNAEEMGGVYSLGGNGANMMGGFGGKR